MPAHIYLRTGGYGLAVRSTRAAAAADHAYELARPDDVSYARGYG